MDEQCVPGSSFFPTQEATMKASSQLLPRAGKELRMRLLRVVVCVKRSDRKLASLPDHSQI